MTKTEYLIFTQDDIMFEKCAIRYILKEFDKDKEITMVVSRVRPMPATTLIEHILEVGVNGVYRIGEMWNGGDNYLLANGRVMAFRVNHLRKMNVMERVANLDAYLYFENKLKGGRFKYVKKAVVWNKSPVVIDEYMHQSSRFQYSMEEMKGYFNNLETQYIIPRRAVLTAAVYEFLTNPIYTILYISLYVYSRVKRKSRKFAINPAWRADISTKKVK